MWSTSGRSSRSTFTLTKCRFISAAISGFSNDSRSITWHQWHAEYPTESRTGLSSARARAKASSPHGYQSTGLCACCSRYGLVSRARRLVNFGGEVIEGSAGKAGRSRLGSARPSFGTAGEGGKFPLAGRLVVSQHVAVAVVGVDAEPALSR